MRTSRASSSRTRATFRRRRNCCTANWRKKSRKRWPGLPENQRTAILLCRQEELSYEEIAEILDCSLSATKSLIHRGRETLKEKLKPYLKTGDWSG